MKEEENRRHTLIKKILALRLNFVDVCSPAGFMETGEEER